MDLGENPTLAEKVEANSELKTWLVDYVGEKVEPENGQITVENIVEVMAKEFPEFLMAVAEENWIRGYHQALVDVEEGKKLYEQEQECKITDEEWVEGYKKCKTGKCGKCE
tara:strand:+ start:1624 stop:1956 length:333 start_codon:yes stop_codon:yes gene_type:complete